MGSSYLVTESFVITTSTGFVMYYGVNVSQRPSCVLCLHKKIYNWKEQHWTTVDAYLINIRPLKLYSRIPFAYWVTATTWKLAIYIFADDAKLRGRFDHKPLRVVRPRMKSRLGICLYVAKVE